MWSDLIIVSTPIFDNISSVFQADKPVRIQAFVTQPADELEKHGFGSTKVFLLEKQSHASSAYQARALLRVLEKLEKYPDIVADRKTARLIIKAIDSLKSKGRG